MHNMKMIWLATAAAILSTGSVQAQAQGLSASDEPSGDIIVTASKRDEKLRDVPSAITVLSSATIETLGIRDFRDYASITPGLSQRDFGAPGTGTIILRGLNTGPQQTTNTTAFYIDDAAFSASGFLSIGSLVTPSPDLVDVERIEVLKGPQGTLYGASSLGGLVRVLTKKADTSTLSGMVQAEGETVAHGNQGGAIRAAVNVPLIEDKLAIRVSGFYRKTGGWADNVFDGDTNFNTSTIKGGRVALRATPSDRLTIDINGFYQDIRNDGTAGQDNVTGTLRPRYGRYKSNVVTGYGASDIKYRSVGGTANYETDAGNVIATANYVESKTAFHSDYSEIYGPYLTLLGILPAGTQVVADFGPNLKKYSAEARFVSKRLGPIEFMAGGFYTHEQSHYPFLITDRTAAGVVLPAPFNILLRSNTGSKYDEYAAFGNLTFYITDRFDVQGGIRYAHNKQTSSAPAGISFFAPVAPGSSTFKDNATTYLVNVRFRPTETVSLYARAASGYRPGGPQSTRIVLPPTAQTQIRADTVWNYEAGIKASALNGALAANLAVYRIDWKDIQLNTLFNGLTLLGNAGKARVDGFEMELTARPTRYLTIGATAGHTNARITAIDPTAQATLGAKSGDKLPLTPGFTVATFADQSIPLSDTLVASIGGTLRFESDKPSSYPGYFLNPNVKIPSITTIDLRAGLEIGQRYGLQLRVENLLDVEGITSLATNAIYPGQPVPTNVTTTRPRTIILSATAKF